MPSLAIALRPGSGARSLRAAPGARLPVPEHLFEHVRVLRGRTRTRRDQTLRRGHVTRRRRLVVEVDAVTGARRRCVRRSILGCGLATDREALVRGDALAQAVKVSSHAQLVQQLPRFRRTLRGVRPAARAGSAACVATSTRRDGVMDSGWLIHDFGLPEPDARNGWMRRSTDVPTYRLRPVPTRSAALIDRVRRPAITHDDSAALESDARTTEELDDQVPGSEPTAGP